MTLRNRLRFVLAMMAAASLAIAAGPALAQTPAPAAPSGTAAEKPAAEPSPAAATGTPATVQPAPTVPAGTELQPPKGLGKKVLTPEEIRQLPIFTRYDDATWQQMLARGKALLSDVKDNTFDYDEEAFYWMVSHVNKLPADLLTPDEKCLPFGALLAMPSGYRGEPVTLCGAYLQMEQFQVPVLALRKDVPYFYACTIRELPLDTERPVATVIVLEDPTLYLHRGDNIRVKGYFYKIRAYKGSKGTGFAPMIAAQRLEPLEGPAPGTGLLQDRGAMGGTFQDPYVMLMMFAVVALIVVFFFIRFRLRGKAKAHATSERAVPIHKFRLHRPNRIEPPAPGGPGGESGGPKS